MTEDLLTRIQRETHERLRELRDVVDEHDRLQADLRALDAAPGPLAKVALPAALEIAPEPPVAPESPATPQAALEPSLDTGPPTNVVRLPVNQRVSRARLVSPKVARLMGAPRRPALERAGVVRVGAGRVASSPAEDLWPQEVGEEVDAEAEVYEWAV